jgi:hypothetical protein
LLFLLQNLLNDWLSRLITVKDFLLFKFLKGLLN